MNGGGWRAFALLLLRLVLGSLLILNGLQTMERFHVVVVRHGELKATLAVVSQLGGGGAIVLGLFTRLAGLLVTGVMFYVAYEAYVRRSESASIEAAVMGAVGLFFFWTGPGSISFDNRIFRPRHER